MRAVPAPRLALLAHMKLHVSICSKDLTIPVHRPALLYINDHNNYVFYAFAEESESYN